MEKQPIDNSCPDLEGLEIAEALTLKISGIVHESIPKNKIQKWDPDSLNLLQIGATCMLEEVAFRCNGNFRTIILSEERDRYFPIDKNGVSDQRDLAIAFRIGIAESKGCTPAAVGKALSYVFTTSLDRLKNGNGIKFSHRGFLNSQTFTGGNISKLLRGIGRGGNKF